MEPLFDKLARQMSRYREVTAWIMPAGSRRGLLAQNVFSRCGSVCLIAIGVLMLYFNILGDAACVLMFVGTFFAVLRFTDCPNIQHQGLRESLRWFGYIVAAIILISFLFLIMFGISESHTETGHIM